MNNQFKNEFSCLNPEEIKYIINRCAGMDILQYDITKIASVVDANVTYFIKYIEDENYGFWKVEWGLKKADKAPMTFGSYFQYGIKILPFKIEFENANTKSTNKKQIEEYLQIYINKKCPHYTQAIREEAENFIKMLNFATNQESGEDLSK